VKVGGMCWVISTGAWSMTACRLLTTRLSACGPPVDEPISSTRGGITGNGRNTSLPGSGALGAMLGASTLGPVSPRGRTRGPTGTVGA